MFVFKQNEQAFKHLSPKIKEKVNSEKHGRSLREVQI